MSSALPDRAVRQPPRAPLIAPSPRRAWAGSRHVLPGLGLSLGITMTWLSLIVLVPLGWLVINGASLGPATLWAETTNPRTLAALKLSFGAALIAAAIDLVAAMILSWVLVRYRFPGRAVVDAMIDLPFALPTAVAGLALTALYSPNGWLGGLLPEGWRIAYTQAGIVVALAFVGLPFAVRTVQPVLADLEIEAEAAAATLGASRWRTLTRVVLPPLLPALATGFALAFARAVGEYGSVIFIAGNLPEQTEIAPLLIVIQLEQYDYDAAIAIACAMLAVSFLLLFVINSLQALSRRWSVAA